MNTKDNCLVKIQSILPSLRGVELKAACYILEHPDTVLDSPIVKLSNQIGIAESSVIRFCRKLGYSGFSAFKINLAISIHQNAQYNLDDLTLESNTLDAAQTMEHVFAQTRLALEQALQIVSPTEFKRAADLLCATDSISFFGIGASAPVAQDAYYRFSRLDINVSYAVDPYAMLLTTNYIKKNCVVIGISHTGRSKETLRAMQKAREQNAHTICITSYLDSPITKCSDVKLITSAAESNVIHEAITSRITHLSLLDSLYTYLVMNNYQTSSAKLEKINKIMREARE